MLAAQSPIRLMIRCLREWRLVCFKIICSCCKVNACLCVHTLRNLFIQACGSRYHLGAPIMPRLSRSSSILKSSVMKTFSRFEGTVDCLPNSTEYLQLSRCKSIYTVHAIQKRSSPWALGVLFVSRPIIIWETRGGRRAAVPLCAGLHHQPTTSSR